MNTSHLLSIEFDYCPLFDIQIDIKCRGYIWKILDLPESIDYSDTDLYYEP